MNARALFLVLVLTSVFPERASSQAAKQRNPTIGEVRVIGNRTLNRASIIAASGLEIGQALKPERIAEAKRRLLSVGNFGAGLENPEDGVSIKTVVDGELVTVLIIVVENELVRGFQITGSGPIPLSAILAIVEPMRNQVLNLPVLQRKVSEIRRLYEDRGYQGFVSEDMALKSGILHIPITVGKVGGIRIDGLDAEMYWFILSFLLTKPYDYYNVRHLAGDIAWLKAIGIDLQIHIPDGAGPEVEWIPVGGDLWFKVKPRIPKTAKSVEQHESIRNEPRITEIRVVGARQVTPESIIMASGLKIGDYLATDRFPDAARKVAALGAFGLRQRIPPYGVKIDSEEFRHKASVTIEVDENPVIRGFEIQNSGPIPGVEIIRLLDQHRGGC